jgi:hypothetical protein
MRSRRRLLLPLTGAALLVPRLAQADNAGGGLVFLAVAAIGAVVLAITFVLALVAVILAATARRRGRRSVASIVLVSIDAALLSIALAVWLSDTNDALVTWAFLAPTALTTVPSAIAVALLSRRPPALAKTG